MKKLSNEIWRPVDGFPDYNVSNMGRVVSFKRKGKRTFLKMSNGSELYLKVALCRNRKRTTFRVHRLVLIAFKGKPPKGCEASHLNGDSLDCKLSNLQWESRLTNCRRKQDHGTQTNGQDVYGSKLLPHQVRRIREWEHLPGYGGNTEELADNYGVSTQTIRDIVARRTWAHI